MIRRLLVAFGAMLCLTPTLASAAATKPCDLGSVTITADAGVTAQLIYSAGGLSFATPGPSGTAVFFTSPGTETFVLLMNTTPTDASAVLILRSVDGKDSVDIGASVDAKATAVIGLSQLAPLLKCPAE